MRFERRIAFFFIFILALSVPAALSSGGQAAGKADDAALLKLAREDFGRLPPVIAAANNPVTPAKIALGKMLFYETRFSGDGTVSCVRCHPFSLYGADGLRRSVGAGGKPAARNAPTVLNAAGQISAHWVGNRKDVEDQATQSLIGNASPGAPSADAATKELQKIAAYGPLFRDAFPGEKDPVNAVNYGRAVGAFERTLVTPSAFDAFLDGNVKALADAQKAGLARFIETGCVQCHSGAYVGGQTYEMFGVHEPYWTYTKSPDVDEGRFTVTKNPDDKYVFKVPGLRNVAMTPPYFHDGSVARLSDAVWIMGKIQLGMSLAAPQVESIVACLASLTGEIPAEALRVPILPRRD
jgi:cytochrome c peroxidase